MPCVGDMTFLDQALLGPMLMTLWFRIKLFGASVDDVIVSEKPFGAHVGDVTFLNQSFLGTVLVT